MSEEEIKYEKTLQKGISLLENNPNAIIEIMQVSTKLTYLRGRLFEQSQQKNVQEGASHPSTLGTDTQTAPADNLQDYPGQTSGVDNGDTGDGTFPADLKSKNKQEANY